jgi:hypothetical protein
MKKENKNVKGNRNVKGKMAQLQTYASRFSTALQQLH